jgi:hypothetical protein
MTDDPSMDDDLLADETAAQEPAVEPEGGFELEEQDAPDEYGVPGADVGDMDPEAILAEAALERMHRQAYWHHTSKQLFAFLFANCLFLAGTLVAWTRAVPGVQGDPSLYITGLDTIRGSFIFALAIYGFWTAVFNVWHGQMKVWPYLLNAVLALWIGIGGFVAEIGSERWDQAKAYLDTHNHSFLENATVPLSVVAPGFWLLAAGGLIVIWIILHGLLGGRQAVKAQAAEGGGSSRRRR